MLTSAVLLCGQPTLAHSAVFEELDNGSVVNMNDGVSADTPSTVESSHLVDRGLAPRQSNTLQQRTDDGVTDVPPTATGSVVVDMPRSGSHRRTALISISGAPTSAPGEPLRLPQPRLLTAAFSAEQTQMRRLAVTVGRRYARTSAVRRARLDQDDFVELFTLMIHRESNFNPMAVSRTGAKGLGQLMPATARDLGVCDVFSAQQNLEGAARYLTDMLDRFGSPELALAAYNAGPDAVRRYGGVPPYRETQQYVSDIIHAVNRTRHVASPSNPRGGVAAENSGAISEPLSVATVFGFRNAGPPEPQSCASEARANAPAFN